MSKIPLVSVSGNHYEIGYQIGEALSKNIKRTINFPIEFAEKYLNGSLKDFINNSKKYLPYANKYFPEYVKELQGIAKGSGQDFDLIWLLNVEEALIDFKPSKCTSIILRDNENIYLYHNEDYLGVFKNNISIIKANINNKIKFLSFTFAGMIPGFSVSLNSYGLIQGINSLHPLNTRLGVPKIFIARAILDCKNVKEAINVFNIKERAAADHHNLIQGKQAFSIETTPNKYKIFNVNRNYFVHTNNYLYPKFRDSEILHRSIGRLNKARESLKLSPNRERALLIMKDHSKISPICRHKKKDGYDVTLSSMIVDCKNLVLYATNGNPCKNKYYEYKLD